VVLPPGCARLVTNPAPTGSADTAITMGIAGMNLEEGRESRQRYAPKSLFEGLFPAAAARARRTARPPPHCREA